MLPFNGDMEDTELLYLQDYLLKLCELPEGTAPASNLSVFGLDHIRNCKESSQYLDVIKASAEANSWARIDTSNNEEAGE
jgi:hypothetical protein